MKIGCVLVLYNPDKEVLLKTLSSIIPQVEEVFIADNSFLSNEWVKKNYDEIIYQRMQGNIGIAAAQNAGIKHFTEHNFSHIIFLDQDSIVAEALVSQLVADLDLLEKRLILVGGIGPRPVNRESNKEYRARVRKGKSITPDITEVTEIISSGSLVQLKLYKEIGLYEESLFIDGVDHEWCWRAKKIKNLRFFISEEALLSHKFGEGDHLFILKNVAISTPFRNYYQFRNYFVLLRRSYVPLYWKITNGFKFLIKLFYYPIFITPRIEHLKNILRGIKDGIFIKRNISY